MKDGSAISNDFFGEMIDAGNYYECRKLFRPIGKVVEIGLEKKEQGPDEKQKKFFNWIENNYDLLIEKVSPSIERRVQDWLSNYEVKDFQSEYTLEYLYIPRCDEGVFDWQISFYVENELQHWCSLEMRGLEVIEILIDG